MNKNNGLIIALLIILIVIAGYIALKPQPSPTAVNTYPNGQTTTNTNPNGQDYTPSVTTTPDANAVTKTAWGISFEKGSNFTIASNTSSQVVLKQTSGQGVGDTITISYITGNSITDGDGKFGNITYSYDTTQQTWVQNSLDEQSGAPTTAKVTPTYNANGWPILPGRAGWKTVIIPLSHTTFVKLNISGSGQTQALDDLVATLQKN